METPQSQPGVRPEHYSHAKHDGHGIKLPKDLYIGRENMEEGKIRLMAGEFVNIRRSPKDGEEEGKIQEAVIVNFNDQTGDANVSFDHESGGVGQRTINRKDLEKWNPAGSRMEKKDIQ
ncbi:MAG: hypothetical protein ABIJ23_04040 [Candidatus Magasanikbacteria bacterium]